MAADASGEESRRYTGGIPRRGGRDEFSGLKSPSIVPVIFNAVRIGPAKPRGKARYTR
jgi:hypothetical protein